MAIARRSEAKGRRVLREKELRIALVCFGGISLAIYMHGISKEILKLVRASRALHAIADRSRRAQTKFFDCVDGSDPEHDAEHDTEAVYFELLREIGRSLELRVIVDIIAGASAGGINGDHACAGLEPRPADGGAARALAQERRC